MSKFLRLYRWSMQMKLRMGMYTLVAIVTKIVFNYAQGMDSVRSLDLLSMWLVCLLFAMVETGIFPEGCGRSPARSTVWFVAANAFFLGGAWIFGWFQGIPAWGGALLIALVELALFLMWFGDQFVLRADSSELTRQLKQYQRQKPVL